MLCANDAAVGKMLAGNFSAADKEAISMVFKKYDINGDGKLSPSEIKAMMEDLGKPPAEAAVCSIDLPLQSGCTDANCLFRMVFQALFDQYDDDHSGFIEQNEFANIQGAAAVSDEKKAVAMFKSFDANSTCCDLLLQL